MRKRLLEEPEYVKYWDLKKNKCSLNEVFAESKDKYFWICPICNNSWASTIRSLKSTGCPKCSKETNRLKHIKKYGSVADIEELMDEWDYEKNNKIGLDPKKEVKSSRVKANWICKNGHHYESSIAGRVNKRGCPYCSGRKVWVGFNDLVTVNKELCKEWDYKLNKTLPTEYTKGSNKVVYWICPKGHSYQMEINSRFGKRHQGCSICAGKKVVKGQNDLASQRTDLAKEYSKKNKLKADKIFYHSTKDFWWNCPVCHYEYEMSPYVRINNHRGCPMCSKGSQTSFEEQAIYYYLQKSNLNLENPYRFHRKTIDVYLTDYKIGIEYDGNYYHDNPKAKKKDKEKNELLYKNKIILIRFKAARSNAPIKKINKYLYIIKYNVKKQGNKNFEINLIELLKFLKEFIKVKIDCDVNIKRDSQEIDRYRINRPKNNLVELYPEIAKEWNYENNIRKPYSYLYKSNALVWWKCKKCKESWQSTIANRTEHGNGCPKCAKEKRLKNCAETKTKKKGSVKSKYPQLVKHIAQEYRKNLDLTVPGSARHIDWICENCKKHFNNHQIRTIIGHYEKYNNILCDKCLKEFKHMLKKGVISIDKSRRS